MWNARAAATMAALVALLAARTVSADPSLLRNGRALAGDLPPDERAVRSMIVAGGRVFGTTSGPAAHLFVVDGDRVVSLARLPGGVALNGLCRTGDGRTLYAATAAAPDVPGKYVHRAAVGRIIRFDLTIDGGKFAATSADLGAPVPGQGIIAAIRDEPNGRLYGLTEPDGHLYVFELKAGTSRSLGVVAGRRPHETELPAQVSRDLLLLGDGSVLTGGAGGSLVKYDAKAGKVVKTGLTLPAVPGREPWASVDAFAVAADGRIFGGTSDGYIFSIDPGLKEIINHGKPLRQAGIQGLAFGPDGRLYGVGGEKDGMPRGFTFEAARGAFTLGGIPSVGAGEANLSMTGFGALVYDPGGRCLYAGERDRLGRVLRFALPAK